MEKELKRLGLEDLNLTVRMTGCPNGCARPYQSDIGLVGRSGEKFTVFVGGRLLGDRLNFVLRDLVPLNDIVPLLVPVLEHYRESRQDGEGFGQDYAETLRIWRANFDRAVEDGRLPAGFDNRFLRLWRFYLMYCEGGFRGGAIDVAQVTLVKT